jgi:DNA-binding transcriptional ArsR family regulator
MSSDDFSDDVTEKIKIFATDDEKIKSFGEIFTNDSSREILQFLFNEELSATQIAQKTDISLQLVKYHLNKLQDLGIVKISKIEKNSKSQDMKIYTATKFSLVIVPPKFSEKTKESKLLVRSFRHIYKVVGLGIATGLSGLLSLSQIQQDKQVSITDKLTQDSGLSEFVSSTESSESIAESAPMAAKSIPPSEVSRSLAPDQTMEIADKTIDHNILVNSDSDLFIPLIIITVILGGLFVYYLWKLKKSK